MSLRTLLITICKSSFVKLIGFGKVLTHYPFDASLTFVPVSFVISISKCVRSFTSMTTGGAPYQNLCPDAMFRAYYTLSFFVWNGEYLCFP